jgi:hypothetical protein
MAKAPYKVGDLVAIKSGPARTSRDDKRCKVVAMLPDAYGSTQFRVRCDDENFDRRVTGADIEPLEPAAQISRSAPKPASGAGEPWLKTSTIKIGK